MLERLNQIDWQGLEHAYGPASDVPELIRDLTSADTGAREKALSNLYGNIWHQGTVYEATAPTVPFLIELLEADEVQGKHEILIFLAHLATGRSYKDVHQHLMLSRELVDKPEWQAELQQELVWVKNSKDAVALGLPVYRRMLVHPESLVRDAVGYLLASLGTAAKDVAGEIFQRLAIESDDMVKASLVRAFGIVGGEDERTQTRILAFLSGEQPKSLKLAAAMALVGIMRAAAAPQAITVLLDAIQYPDDYSSLQKSCWQRDDTIVSSVSCFLATLEGPAALAAEDALIQALGSEKLLQALTIAGALLQLSFQGPIDPGATMNSLTERQQRVLKAFDANHNLWGLNVKGAYFESANTGLLMRSYHLPSRLSEFQAFVRGERATKP